MRRSGRHPPARESRCRHRRRTRSSRPGFPDWPGSARCRTAPPHGSSRRYSRDGRRSSAASPPGSYRSACRRVSESPRRSLTGPQRPFRPKLPRTSAACSAPLSSSTWQSCLYFGAAVSLAEGYSNSTENFGARSDHSFNGSLTVSATCYALGYVWIYHGEGGSFGIERVCWILGPDAF